jgi:type IV pilus assembly protein PilM
VTLRPVIIDLDVFALVNALANSRDLTQVGTAALIDLGASFTHLNIIQDGLTAFTRDIPLGGLACTQKLMSQFGVTYEDADALKRGEIPEAMDREAVVKTLAESFAKIAEEIEKSIEFFCNTSNSMISQVFLSGGGVLVPGVSSLFRDKLGVMVDHLNPLDGIKVNPKHFDQDLVAKINPIAAVAIGLATRKFKY